MAILNINANLIAFSDSESVTTNPRKRYFDFTTNYNGIRIKKPESDEDALAPSETRTLFSGVRTLTVDGTTEFDLSLSVAYPSVYRLAAVDGTAPGFRTARALTLAAEQVIITVNNNATADFSLDEASSNTFALVQVGDIVFIPGPITGDPASPFSDINQGFWTVLAKGPVGAGANRRLTLRRLPGESFSAVDETVVIVANTDFQAFTSGTVQVGDSLRISAGFSSVAWKTYTVTSVTASWIEFFSSDPLPLEAGIFPGASGITIYTNARNFIRLEVDQDAVVRLNGDTGNFNLLSPRMSADPDGVGYFEMWGTIWSLVLVNSSSGATLNYKLLAATLEQ